MFTLTDNRQFATTELVIVDRARNSVWGRFTSPDPSWASVNAANPQSWNRYSYMVNDPINGYDPSGLDGECGPNGTWMGEGCYNYGGGMGAIDNAYNQYVSNLPWAAGGIISSPDPLPGWDSDAPNCGFWYGTVCAPYLLAPAAGTSSPPPQQHCDVEVGYVPRVLESKYSHSFLKVGIPGISEYIEVSPSIFGFLEYGAPTMKVHFTGTGIYNDSVKGKGFWDDNEPTVCRDALNIYMTAMTFPTALYLGFFSNSNSFVSTVLTDVGITAPPLVTGPPNAIGWGGPIVYPRI